jgi:hypothetical protein
MHRIYGSASRNAIFCGALDAIVVDSPLMVAKVVYVSKPHSRLLTTVMTLEGDTTIIE